MALGGPLRRLAVIAGATLAAMVALVLAKPIYSLATYETPAISVGESPRVVDQGRGIETSRQCLLWPHLPLTISNCSTAPATEVT
jgi:hypothetical protein